jgi:hypothetical protein
MDLKKAFEKFGNAGGFIKTSAPSGIGSADKAALNRKGNVLFNSGEIEKARRIFITTGYSDGISRVGDYYKSNNRFVEAMQMYSLAPDRTKLEPLVMQTAEFIRGLIGKQDGGYE